jgi:hypothetical protein
MISFDFSREENLLVALANPSLEDNVVEQYLTHTIDWRWFYNNCLKHRLLPQLHHLLQSTDNHSCPQSIVTEVAHLANDIITHNQIASLKLVQIMHVLDAHNIQALAYKGPTLAQYLDSTTTMRTFTDLDILIAPEVLSDAIQALSTIGFVLVNKDEQTNEPDFHVTCIHSKMGLEVELHRHITFLESPIYYNFGDLFDRAISVPMGSATVKMPDIETMVALLAVHGSRHMWSQLILVSDIAKILLSTHIQWDRVLRRANELACERSVAIALYYSAELFDIPLPSIVESYVTQYQNLDNQVDNILQILHTESYSQSYFKFYYKHAWWLLSNTSQRILFLYRVANPLQLVRVFYELYFIDNDVIKGFVAKNVK